jgi:hypothetical protein
LEKLNDAYEEKCNHLRDTIDQERARQNTLFFEDLKDREYYRNRKRIEDINNLYDEWNDKLFNECNNFFILVNKNKKKN